MPIELVLSDLLSRYGTPIPTLKAAWPALGFPSLTAAYAAHRRGKLPIPVIDVGGRLSVRLADVARLACGERVEMIPKDSTTVTRPAHARRGHPTKSEQIEAARLGISVPGLRQRRIGEEG